MRPVITQKHVLQMIISATIVITMVILQEIVLRKDKMEMIVTCLVTVAVNVVIMLDHALQLKNPNEFFTSTRSCICDF